jgi:AraC-like DNA-binding protein
VASVNRVAALAERLERAERRVDELREQLQDEIRNAHADGATLALIARAAGISRSRVHQIVRG